MKRSLKGKLACGLFPVVALIVAGCGGGGPERHEVTGTVNFDGQPVAEGQIAFRPADGAGPSDAGQIVDGKFTCEVTPGAKRVEITATRESEEAAPDGMPNYEDYIPAQFNTESTLTADVKSGGENTFTFDLKPDGS